MKTRFLKQWVNIQLNGSDGHFRAFIKKVGVEAGATVYVVKYEDGTEEPIFIDSIFRIWGNKKAKVIRLKKKTPLRLIK